MNKLNKLADMIIKDGKMTSDEVISKLSDAVVMGDCDFFNDLYEAAYGKVIIKSLAETYVKDMAVTDGSERSDGQKWTMDQTTDVGNKIGIDWNMVSKAEWYLVMNMVYSDFYKTAKYAEKQADPIFYAHLAKDWVCDDDAPKDKVFRYVFNVLS